MNYEDMILRLASGESFILENDDGNIIATPVRKTNKWDTLLLLSMDLCYLVGGFLLGILLMM